MMRARSLPLIPQVLAAGAAAMTSLGVAAQVVAQPDDSVSEVNALYDDITDEKRSDLILLPKVLELDEMPPGFEDFEPDEFEQMKAIMSWDPPARDDWVDVEAWLMAPAQRALVEALAQATADERIDMHMAFAQPYGVEGVAESFELVEAGYYTEIGDPPCLAAAYFGYIDAIDQILVLGWLETFRLQAKGDPEGAIEVAMDMLFLSRQIADRALLDEVLYGMRCSMFALARVREIAFEDSKRSSPLLRPAYLGDVVARLDPLRSAATVDRIVWPRASKIAAKQLVALAYTPGAGPDLTRFATSLARVDVGRHPLRVFSESAKYERIVEEQIDYYAIDELVDDVAIDSGSRWQLSPGSPLLSARSEYDLVGREASVVRAAYKGHEQMFAARQWLATEMAGTRQALSLQAYVLQNRSLPPLISSSRPDFIDRVQRDPYSSASRKELQFFVPVRDTPKGPRGVDKPYPIRVFALDESVGVFSLNLLGDTFCLYSVGVDRQAFMANEVVQGDEGYSRGDYILWPPYSSLVRKFLKDTGRIP